MALMEFVDVAKVFTNKVRKRIREQGMDADFRDIENEIREQHRKDNSRIRCRLIKTQLLGLYEQDAEALQKDLTKLIMLEPATPQISRVYQRELLMVLWSSAKSSLSDLECDSVVQEIQHMVELNRKYAKEDNAE